jgi:hypothetical protein
VICCAKTLFGQAQRTVEDAHAGVEGLEPGNEPRSLFFGGSLKFVHGIPKILTENLALWVTRREHNHGIDFFRGWQFSGACPVRGV